MGYQQIKGIKVSPVGGGNRHFPDKTLYWDKTGYAFGGWIYNTQLDIGFSQQPTTIGLDIALDAQATSPNGANTLNNSTGPDVGISFDINSGDLNLRYLPPANGGMGENYYTVNIGGNVYEPMYLTSYDINGSSESKTLRVKLVDYSAILDKVQVGLFKRQGYHKPFSKKFKTAPVVDAVCPDCSLSGVDYWHVTGKVTGSIEFGSYFYNHNGVYDLLPDPITGLSLTAAATYSDYFRERKNRHVWPATDSASTNSDKLNINGGTLIIGCEEFNETTCGNLAPVSYNFSELILSLSKAGIRFSQINKKDIANNWNAHISGKIDKNPNYRQNYIGTLREVLNNWSSDFALDFYVTGKTICFIDLAQDTFSAVEKIRKAMIPVGDPLGAAFNSETIYAIASYKEKLDMSDTYEQKIITFDARPRNSENRDKTVKNQCGFIAMHPLDFLGFNDKVTNAGHTTVYGESFSGHYILNPIWDTTPGTSLKDMPFNVAVTGPLSATANNYYTSAGGAYRSHWYTSRPYILIDVCAALGRYSKDLRDIFLGGLIATKLKQNSPDGAAGVTLASAISALDTTLELRALLNSFGFNPLFYLKELHYGDFKQSFLESMMNKKTSDNRQNYLLNSINFEMVIGFHTEENEKEIFEWEQAIAENMYKYGILSKGNLKKPPFLTPDRTDQPPFLAGLTGISGLKVTKIESTTTPDSEKYIDFFELPFKDIYQTSGEYSNPIGKGLNWSGISIAKLDNEWGTSQDDFAQEIKKLSPNDQCDNFKQGSFFSEDAYSSPGGFALNDFAPKFFDITDDLFDELEDELRNSVGNNPISVSLLGKLIEIKREKRTPSVGTDPTYTQYKCPKLKLMVIPNVSNLQTLNARTMGQVQGSALYTAPVPTSELSPHLKVDFGFGVGKNPVMVATFSKFLEQKRLTKLKELPKNICDTDLTTEICNVGRPILNGKLSSGIHPSLPYGVPNLAADCRTYSNNPTMSSITGCQCVSEYTGEYNFGFSSGRLMNEDNCRSITIDFLVNDTARINAYLGGLGLFTVNEKGHVKIVPDDEDFPDFTTKTCRVKIYYPIQSAPLHNVWPGGVGATAPTAYPFYHYYSGLLNTELTIQVRSPEVVEVHGNYWSGFSNVARIEQINNEVEQDIQQQIDPVSKGFFKPVYDMQGNRVSTVSGYHNLITGMTSNSNKNPNLSLEFEVVGDAADINNFKDLLTPASGLSSFSYSLGQDGYRSNVSFASRPKKLPNREAILNKIKPRL